MEKRWKQPGIFSRFCRMSVRSVAAAVCKAVWLTAAFSYVFYRSWFGMLLLPILALYCLLQEEQAQKQAQRTLLARQFTDTIQSVTGSLQSGYSIENAFLEAEKEICALHGKDSLMAAELGKLRHGMHNRISIEQQLLRFGYGCEVEEIRDFTEVFAILKRSGGNLREMIRRTADLTGQRLEVEQEITQQLSSRSFELKIMTAVPFCLYGYVELTSPGFFDVLYHNLAGVCVMTVCLAVYMGAIALAWKISNIQV